METDGALGVYRLGRADSFRDLDGKRVASESGPIPTTALAGYSSFGGAEGWIIALGHADGSPSQFTAWAFSPSQPLSTRSAEELDRDAWTVVESCRLAGGLWAAQLRTTDQWVRIRDGERVEVWFRPLRRTVASDPLP